MCIAMMYHMVYKTYLCAWYLIGALEIFKNLRVVWHLSQPVFYIQDLKA